MLVTQKAPPRGEREPGAKENTRLRGKQRAHKNKLQWKGHRADAQGCEAADTLKYQQGGTSAVGYRKKKSRTGEAGPGGADAGAAVEDDLNENEVRVDSQTQVGRAEEAGVAEIAAGAAIVAGRKADVAKARREAEQDVEADNFPRRRLVSAVQTPEDVQVHAGGDTPAGRRPCPRWTKQSPTWPEGKNWTGHSRHLGRGGGRHNHRKGRHYGRKQTTSGNRQTTRGDEPSRGTRRAGVRTRPKVGTREGTSSQRRRGRGRRVHSGECVVKSRGLTNRRNAGPGRSTGGRREEPERKVPSHLSRDEGRGESPRALPHGEEEPGAKSTSLTGREDITGALQMQNKNSQGE